MIPTKKLRNGLEMPTLGLGTWLMGGDVARDANAPDAQDIATIRAAIEMGYTHIDTAEIYAAGRSEELVGEAIKGFAREKLFIATKASHHHHEPAQLEAALNASLGRMSTPYVDLYYLHRPTLETPLEDTAKGLNALLASGKIKHIGVCNFSAARFDALNALLDKPLVANQIHYNLAFREPEKTGMFEHAAKHDYFVIGWRPLRFRKRGEPNPTLGSSAWNVGAFPVLDEMAKKYNVSNVQVALKWACYHPNALTLTKSSKAQRLQEAMAAFTWKMSAQDYATLSAEFAPQFDKSDTIPLI